MDGSNTREFCFEHRREGMIRISNSQCGPRLRAAGVKRRGGSSFLTAVLTEISPRRGSGGASRRARPAASAVPLALLDAQDRRGTPSSGLSSSFSTAVKEEVVPASSVEAGGARGGRGGPHGIPLSLLGVRSCVQGGRHGASSLTSFDPVQASEVRCLSVCMFVPSSAL